MDWSLLGCGAKGHFTYAPDDRALAERLSLEGAGGTAWRCLRCGAFVPGAPAVTGPVASVPHVRRGKELRSALILRLFAVERFIRAVLAAVIAVALWRFSYARTSIEEAFDRELPALRALLRELGFNIDHSKLLGLIQHAFTLNSRTLAWLAIGAGAYAVIEIAEGIGLWLLKRWGEYFAMVATSAGLPYEIYDLTAKVTVLRMGAFIVNLALVAYLVLTKRLFGVRGGKKAYEARLRSESILQAEIKKAARTRAGAQHPPSTPATGTGGPPAPAAAQHPAAQHPAAPAPGQAADARQPGTAVVSPGPPPRPVRRRR